jgi:hypothetical protein
MKLMHEILLTYSREIGYVQVQLCSQAGPSRVGGVVVSVLATGPKGRGFRPG